MASAAGIAINTVKIPVREATSRLSRVASPILLILAMLAYQSIEKDFGGNSMNWEPLKETTIVRMTGNTRTAIAAQPRVATTR